MKTVSIDLKDRSYDILIAPGILDDGKQLRPWICGQQVFIITNEVVAPLYLEKITNSLADKSVEKMILKDGESVKTLRTAQEIFDRMISVPLDRSTTVIALGGGVVGDIAGFVAACYQRGIPFIQIPTTFAFPGRFICWWQNRSQSSAGKEHDWRIPPAAKGIDRCVNPVHPGTEAVFPPVLRK